MTNLKRILVALLALTMIFVLAACDNNSGTSSADPSSTDPVSDTSEDVSSEDPAPTDITVNVFIYDFADPYIASVRDAMKANFESASITADFFDAAGDQALQTEQIQTSISQDVDLLVVNIVTTASDDAAMTVVDAAKAADIPLIFFNREVSDAVVNSYEKCAFVGTDADEAGYLQGELIYDIISADFDKYDLDGNGKIRYIMFKGELGNAEADGRTQYSVEEANRLFTENSLGTLEYYEPAATDLFRPCNWKAADAQNDMQAALGTNPMDSPNAIELVIANNDDMALGAIEALSAAGYNTEGGDKSIPVVGVDATVPAQESIAKGRMTGTIKQDAEGMASGIVSLCSNIASGADLMANTENMNVDSGVAKIRIPYAKYTG
ncbi:MAG TPA: LacI family transcriptional regulator [Ruminococcaceae bacterium]|nr:LacI family transcriptional regulator [Oscillospiraceae bacterium]